MHNHLAGRQAGGFSRWLNEGPATNPEILADSRAEGLGQADTPWSLVSKKSHHIKDFSRCYWRYPVVVVGGLRLS